MKQLYNPEVIENMRASRRLAGKQSSKATQRRKGFFSPAETRVATKENMSNILNQRTETPDKIVNNWLESLDSAREEAISQISDRKNTNTPREDSIETQNKKEPFPEKDYPVSKREDVSGSLILTPRQAELLDILSDVINNVSDQIRSPGIQLADVEVSLDPIPVAPPSLTPPPEDDTQVPGRDQRDRRSSRTEDDILDNALNQ